MNLRLKICNARPAALAAGVLLAAFMVSNGVSQQPAPNPAAAATNAFGLDLYRQLASDSGNAGRNLWFSPYSITSALAMTAEAARSTINTWIAEQTRQKITNLLPQGAVDSLIRLVLTNAVYFKGAWSFPFNARATSAEPFRIDAAKAVAVPLMRMSNRLGYMENDQLQAITMPFRGQGGVQGMTMAVILPKQVDGLAEVEKSLTGTNLDAWLGAFSNRLVQLLLPKFKMTNDFALGKVLSVMGMPDAFDLHRADFSGISPLADKDRLRITNVIHKAYLVVDEEGAEAAAATAVAMGGAAPRPEDPVVFRADHPFLVLLRHNPSGTILFLGRVMNPAAH